MTQEQTITEHKSAVSVKNARLFYDHKRTAFRLIHYHTEILTVKCLMGENKTDPEIVQINPVSDSSKNAIQEALFYIFGEWKDIDSICKELNTNRKELSKEFWGFDAFARYPYHKRPIEEWKNRPSTFNEVTWSLKRFTKSDWLEISERLASTKLPQQKVIA